MILAAVQSPEGTLLQYGAIGAIAVIAIGGVIWFIREQGKRTDRLEDENRAKDGKILALAERFAVVAEQGIVAHREARDLLIEMRAEQAAAERYRGRK